MEEDILERLRDPAASPTQGLVELHNKVIMEITRLREIEIAYNDLEDYNEELRDQVIALKQDNKFLQEENANLQESVRKEKATPTKKGVAAQFVPEYDDLQEYNKLLQQDAKTLMVENDGKE